MGPSFKKPIVQLLLLVTVVVLLTTAFTKWSDTVGRKFHLPLRPVTIFSWSMFNYHRLVNLSEIDKTTNSLYNASVISHHPVSDSMELNEGIAKDLFMCSLAMGVSPGVLESNRDKISLISSRASHFLKVFWEVVPKNYLPELKNPCWYTNERSSWGRTNQVLKCLPYFLIPGVPKSGTTTLHHVLSQHPQISAPTPKKEPQWWYMLPLKEPPRRLKTVILSYLSYFNTAAHTINNEGRNGIVTYDASQTMLIDVLDYTFSIDNEDYCVMASMLSRVLPKAKIVVIMRDPVPRAYSHFIYYHGSFSWWKNNIKNVSLYFHNHIQAAVHDFDKCLGQNRSIYECTNEVRTDREDIRIWLGEGIYYLYLLKCMQFWPRENFLFLKTETMADKPFSLLSNITKFLSLDPVQEETAMKWFSKKQNVQHNLPKTQDSEMLSTTTQLLEHFYAPYNERLEKLIGITLAY